MSIRSCEYGVWYMLYGIRWTECKPDYNRFPLMILPQFTNNKFDAPHHIKQN